LKSQQKKSDIDDSLDQTPLNSKLKDLDHRSQRKLPRRKRVTA